MCLLTNRSVLNICFMSLFTWHYWLIFNVCIESISSNDSLQTILIWLLFIIRWHSSFILITCFISLFRDKCSNERNMTCMMMKIFIYVCVCDLNILSYWTYSNRLTWQLLRRVKQRKNISNERQCQRNLCERRLYGSFDCLPITWELTQSSSWLTQCVELVATINLAVMHAYVRCSIDTRAHVSRAMLI
jgi:hypothetical protein